jgi:hypothetical protein
MFNTILQWKSQGLLGVDQEIHEMNLEQSVVPESKGNFFLKKNTQYWLRGSERDNRNHLKSFQ